MNGAYHIKSVLEIIFKVTNKNLNILAHSYLLKDKSIISKWKSNKAVPRNDDINRIVEFVINESTLSQQKIIRSRIEELIKSESIKNEIQDIVLHNQDFSEFLREAISMSVSLNDYHPESDSFEKGNHIEENSIKGLIEEKDGRYKGNLEFDLVITQGNETKSVHSSGKSGLKLKGNVNLTSKNSFVKSAKYIKKAAAFGAVFILIVSGSILADSFDGTKENHLKVLGHKDKNPDDTNGIYTAKPTQMISAVGTPVQRSLSTPVPADNTAMPVQSPEKVQKKRKNSGTVNKTTIHETKVNETTVSKNTVNKTTVTNNQNEKNTIINNGDNAVILMGNQSSIGIEKD